MSRKVGVPSKAFQSVFVKQLNVAGSPIRFPEIYSIKSILRKRENYRRAFADFNVGVVGRFTESDFARLMNEDGIVRNRAKISSAQNNACCFMRVQSDFGSFSNYLWDFFDDEPLVNCWQDFEQVPSKTKLSQLISQDMTARGFNFFGPTICYSYLQAMGFINDHLQHCFRWSECQSSN